MNDRASLDKLTRFFTKNCTAIDSREPKPYNVPPLMKQHKSQTVGIFTGGGTAPGLNHAALGATLVLQKNGHTVLGLPNGYDGLLGLKMEKVLRLSNLTRHQLVSLFSPGGSELGSSRTKITPGMHPQVEETVRALGMDGIVAIGGDDTLKQALELHTAGIVNAVGGSIQL